MQKQSAKGVMRLVRDIVLIEVAAVLAYLAASWLGNYVKLYRNLGLADIVSFRIAQVGFIFLLQTGLIGILLWRWRRQLVPVHETDPIRLALTDEHERLERKSTLRWDIKTGAVNRALEKAVLKTVAAFLNSDGGHIVVGIADDGTTVGLERDFATLARRDGDGWENHFSNILAATLGPSFRRSVKVKRFMHDQKTCALITVSPAARPAYLNDDGREEFFIRTGNGTTSLKMSVAHEYIASRFR